jgi:hypothetical protein
MISRIRALFVASLLVATVAAVAAAPVAAGRVGRISTSPTSINFGRAPAGQDCDSSTDLRAIYVTNGLKLPVTVNSLQLLGDSFDFGWYCQTGGNLLTWDCLYLLYNGTLLGPGETCVIRGVAFTPYTAGSHSAALVMGMTDGVATYYSRTTLRGTGT